MTFPRSGFGFSPTFLEAFWRELEPDQADRDPACPFPADLLDLALGLLDGPTSEILNRHLAGCVSCQARLASQKRAIEQSSGSVPAGAPTLLDQLSAEFAARIRPPSDPPGESQMPRTT